MNVNQIESRLYSFWRLQIVGWLAYIVFYYIHMLLFREIKMEDIHRISIIFLSGFFLTWLLRMFYKRLDYQALSMLGLAVIVVGASFLSANIWFWGSRYLALTTLHGHAHFMNWIQNGRPPAFIAPIFFDSILFISWSAMYFTIKIWMEWNNEKKDAETATHSAQNTQLQMIRYQLNPHFLFNALNSIRALIAEDKKNAKAMITDLSDFLRYALVSKNHPIVPLKNEIEAVREYLAIEKRRYEDKLDIDFLISPGAGEYPILSFLIQPIAENAVRQGLQTSPLPVKINIVAKKQNGSLFVTVSNSGDCIEDLSEEDDHVLSAGLANVRERLENTYPDAHSLVQSNVNGCSQTQLIIHKAVQDPNEEEI